MLPQFPDMSLSLEQQFDLRAFTDQLKNLSRQELEAYLIMVIRQNMARQNISKGLIQQILSVEHSC